MGCVLMGLHWKTCLGYLDDIIVIGRTFDKHIKNLEEVLQRITTAGRRLSVKKCALFQKQVKYLGHLLTADLISTDEDKIRAVKDWPHSQNLHEMCNFLRLRNYIRFVPIFANVAASLHEFTKKSKVYQWGELQEEAFRH